MGIGSSKYACERKYGWKKELFDHNDRYHQFENATKEFVDLRGICPKVYDQGSLGSCTANAIAAAYEVTETEHLRKQDIESNTVKKYDFTPSRLFIYYNERVKEDTILSDSGAMIRDGIQSIHTLGVCPETMWPYDINKFTYKPSTYCYKNAEKHTTTDYKKVKQTLNDLKACLEQNIPFVFGFSVYESFESEHVAKTGEMPLPKVGEKLLGGHAVMAVGYDDNLQYFIIRNSWGENWGIKGYFHMPYEFILNPNYASDFWTVIKSTDS